MNVSYYIKSSLALGALADFYGECGCEFCAFGGCEGELDLDWLCLAVVSCEGCLFFAGQCEFGGEVSGGVGFSCPFG